DNDPFRLWSTILRAVRTVAHSPELDHLSPPSGPMDHGFLAAFVNAIDARGTPIRLVLDDAHKIHDATTLARPDKLLAYLPQLLRSLIAARADPPLAELRRMRLDGRLSEIRTSLLAFQRHEAITLLGTHDVHLRDRDLDLVLARTEGWPAGLRLAGISLARANDPSAAVAALGQDRPAAADH